MFNIKYPLTIIFLFLLMSSCKSRRNTLFNTDREKNIPNLPIYVMQRGTDSLPSKEQIIMPGDLLVVQNLQNANLISQGGQNSPNTQNVQNLSTGGIRYRVENDSTVVLPVIGQVKLGGLSRVTAQEKLNKLYQNDLLKDPIMTLAIVNLQVTMLGEFGRQGNYVLNKDQVSLVTMLGEAGGLNPRANKRRIKIIRGDYVNPYVFIVNLEDINSLNDPRLFLRNNDIVYAETKGVFQTLDAISPTASLLGIGVTALNLYLLINTLSR